MAALLPPQFLPVSGLPQPILHLTDAPANQSQCLFCGASLLWIVLGEVRELQKQPKFAEVEEGGWSVHCVPHTWEEPVQWDSAISELLFECPLCVRHRHRPQCRGDTTEPQGRITSPLYLMLWGLGGWGSALVLYPGQDRAGLGPISQQS